MTCSGIANLDRPAQPSPACLDCYLLCSTVGVDGRFRAGLYAGLRPDERGHELVAGGNDGFPWQRDCAGVEGAGATSWGQAWYPLPGFGAYLVW